MTHDLPHRLARRTFRIAAFLVLALLVLPAMAEDREVTIEFRFHPDDSGMKTQNQSVTIEEDEDEFYLEVEGPTADEIVEKETTAGAFAEMLELVRRAVSRFEFESGEEVEGAHVEVTLEFESADREAGVTYTFPKGEVPEPFVKLQEKYFRTAWD